jgi:hypothetical protein
MENTVYCYLKPHGLVDTSLNRHSYIVDEGNMFLQDVGTYLPDYTASIPEDCNLNINRQEDRNLKSR